MQEIELYQFELRLDTTALSLYFVSFGKAATLWPALFFSYSLFFINNIHLPASECYFFSKKLQHAKVNLNIRQMLKSSVLENAKEKSVPTNFCIWLIQRQYLKLIFLRIRDKHIFGAFI